MKIAFCQATYIRDFEDTILCIERVSPHVDITIIVYSQTLNDQQIKLLTDSDFSKKYNIVAVQNEFKDNLPEMRNAYVKKAVELGIDWCCVSDPDELYSEELAKNIRSIIADYDSQGYSLLGIPVRDQCKIIEWIDDLNLLKETPKECRETDYWKPLLVFKILPGIRYEGIGQEKNVHENLVANVGFRLINIPKEYYYIHKREPLKIWKSAARNMFIGGGGDNVGNLNTLWTKLREIAGKLSVNSITEFEEFIEKGIDVYTDEKDIKEQFNNWLINALSCSANSWGTETRETAKLYLIFHKDKIDSQIDFLLKNPPKSSDKTMTEDFVVRTYTQILKRSPNIEEKDRYVENIIGGKITKDQFADMLKSTEEYKQQFVNDESTDKRTMTENIVTKLYIDLLGRPPDEEGKKEYVDAILDEIVDTEQLEYIIKNSDEYIERENRKSSKTSLERGTIGLCIMGYKDGMQYIKDIISITGKFVDEIHVQGDDFGENEIMSFDDLGKNIGKKIDVHIVQWIDDFSYYKNKCVSWANTDWVLILDHDEIPTEEMSKNLKNIIEKSNKGIDYDMVSFDAIDVKTVKGDVMSEHRSSGGKPLFHRNIPEPYCGNPHIWLKSSYYPWIVIHDNIAYRHIKDLEEELARSVRNIFMGGGGDSIKEGNPNWVVLRSLCNELKIDRYKQFDSYLKGGKIDNRILNILKKLAEMSWKDNELKDPLRYYYLLHPDEED